MKIDFHSHILPGIDDGSRSVKESLKLLDMMADDNVDVVVATPHYYAYEQTIDKFVSRRNEAFEKLKPHLKANYPKILLGAEVLYDHSLITNEELPRLCLQGTEYLLWEMPYTKLTDEIIYDTETLAATSGLKLMIAHIERYLNFTSYDELSRLMQLEVIGQLNAKDLTTFLMRRRCKKLIDDGFVYVLGTDYHRVDSGHELLGVAEQIIREKFHPAMLDIIEQNGIKILEDRPLYDLESL